jgi:hypothetical protein
MMKMLDSLTVEKNGLNHPKENTSALFISIATKIRRKYIEIIKSRKRKKKVHVHVEVLFRCAKILMVTST